MAMYPINIDPLTNGIGIDDELEKLNKLRRKAIRPGWSDVLMGLGSSLRSLGSGSPDNAASIIQTGRQNAQAEYERQLEIDQREQALRYIAKTGNPELMAAYQSGMDPSSIIKFNYQEKLAEKQRGWSQEDATTDFNRDMQKLEASQKFQLENDPSLLRAREEAARNESFYKTLFPGVDANPTVQDAGNTTAIPIPQPMAPTDAGPTPNFTPALSQDNIPTVDPMTQRAREVFQIPDLNRSDAQELMIAARQGEEATSKAMATVKARMLQEAEMHKLQGYGPNTTLIDPMNAEQKFVTPPAPAEVPSDIRTAEALRKDPGLFEIYKGMKQSGSGAELPEDVIWQKAGEKMVQEVFPKLTERGGVIAASEAQFQSLKGLLESAPQGLTAESLASQYLPGYSGSAATLQSVVFNMAPKERVEGSGSTSDIEYAGMLKSYPWLLNRPEGNKAIVSILEAKRNIERDKAEIVSEYNSRDISYTKAVKELDRINKKSVLDGVPKEVRDLIAAESAPEAAAVESTQLPKTAIDAGISQEEWNVLTPEERKSLE